MNKEVDVIGVPSDYGASRRGVDMGPSAIRYAGLSQRLGSLGYKVNDTGNIEVPLVLPEKESSYDASSMRFRDEVFQVADRTKEAVAGSLKNGGFPVVLGGDHSLSMGSIAGSAGNDRLGVIWLDAHGDFNTPATTPSGNLHGMSLAGVVGFDDLEEQGFPVGSVRGRDVALIGVRDLDEGEQRNLRGSDVSVYSISDIDRVGLAEVMEEALSSMGDVDGVHVSLDLDWLNPDEAPGVGTPVYGGVSYREAHLALEMVAEEFLGEGLRSVDLVEVNPVMDDSNRTAGLAVELLGSLLGERII